MAQRSLEYRYTLRTSGEGRPSKRAIGSRVIVANGGFGASDHKNPLGNVFHNRFDISGFVFNQLIESFDVFFQLFVETFDGSFIDAPP